MRQADFAWLKVDWEHELNLIRPYFSNQGGIVCIQGDQYSSGTVNFIRLIRCQLKANQGDVCVRLDPEDETTRTPIDIVVKLEQRLGLSRSPVARLRVATNARAGGNLNISNINVSYEAWDFEIAEELAGRTSAILDCISERVGRNKVITILDQWHGQEGMPPRVRSWFWNNVWHNGLESLADRGFVLVSVCEMGDCALRNCRIADEVKTRIVLPTHYARPLHRQVVDDVASILGSWSYTDPHSRASSLLIASEFIPARLHASIARHRIRSPR